MGNDASRVTVVDVCRGSLVRARVWARGRFKLILFHNTILLIYSIPLDAQQGLGGSRGSTVFHQLSSFQLKLIVFHPIVVYILLSMTEVLVGLAMHGTAAVMKLLVCYFFTSL